MKLETKRAFLEGRVKNTPSFLNQLKKITARRCRESHGPFKKGDEGECLVCLCTGLEKNNEEDVKNVDLVHTEKKYTVEVKTDWTRFTTTHLIDRHNRWVHEDVDDGPWRACAQKARYFLLLKIPPGGLVTFHLYDCDTFRTRCDNLIAAKKYKFCKRPFGKMVGGSLSYGLQYSFHVRDFADIELDASLLL